MKEVKVQIVYGSEKFFTEFLSKQEVKSDLFINLSQLVIPINVAPNVDEYSKFDGKILIAESGEYSSLNEHVLSNHNIVFSKYGFKEIFLHNPPDILKESITKAFEVKVHVQEHKTLDTATIKKIHESFSDEIIIGQEKAKSRILTSLIGLLDSNKPVVLLFYGVSGVGKTETAKLLAKMLEGDDRELFRVQFSMYQSEHFGSYLFGGTHNEKSFARQLLEREVNVILIDEFDKVSSTFHNAFYQLFDEGIFVDRNYTVNLKNSIIICTTNYQSEEIIREKLGEPIFSRFDACIEFSPLTLQNKQKIILRQLDFEVAKLDPGIKDNLPYEQIKEALIKKSVELTNFRTLKNFVKELVATYRLRSILED